MHQKCFCPIPRQKILSQLEMSCWKDQIQKKMSKISVLLLFSVVKICSSDYVADSMGQFFLESSIHVDFASSFYNNLKFYFPDFDPEGIKLNSKWILEIVAFLLCLIISLGFTVFDNKSIVRSKRSSHWDETKMYPKKYPVIKWESMSKIDKELLDEDDM